MKENDPQDVNDWLTKVCGEFVALLGSDASRPIEDYLEDSVSKSRFLEELLRIELAWRIQSGQTPTLQEYVSRFPEAVNIVQNIFSEFSDAPGDHQNGSVSLATKILETSDFDSITGIKSKQLTSTQFDSNFATDDFGDYQIIREIAAGGMGVVYQAKHIKLDRMIALKMLLSNESIGVEERKRFKAEAMAVAKLDHPGIVPIYDAGEVNGRPYLAMAYVDGESLAQRVQRKGPMPPRSAVKLIVEIAQAIQHAHDKGIIHRDLKPQNILITENDLAQVTDFGIAKHQESAANLTQTGQIVGTPAYMPPEQASGNLSDVGVRSDVYGLGATLYFLLTARPPFQAANLNEVLRQVIESEPLSPRKLDPLLLPDVETICLKCLAKSPKERYESAASFAEDLVRWLNDEPIKARPASWLERTWKWCRRKPLSAGLSATATLAVILAFATMLERGKRNYIEAQIETRKASLVLSAIEALKDARRYLINDDYNAARAERERLSSVMPDLEDHQELVESYNAISSQIDAVADFEIARVQRCGMPSCQFDYVNFSPNEILLSLGLNFDKDSPDELAKRISQSDIQEEIIASLDDWASVLSECSFDPFREYLPKIVKTCNKLDPDPTRTGIRKSLLDGTPLSDIELADPSPGQVRLQQPSAILFLANTLAKQKKLEASIEMLRVATLQYPNDFWLNLRLAELSRDAGEDYRALTLKQMEITRVLRPTNHVVINNLASLYVEEGNEDTARQLLLSAVKANPSDPNLQHSLNILESSNPEGIAEATRMYQSSIEKFPDFVQSYVNLAILKIKKEDYEEAEKLLNHALNIQSKKCDISSPHHADLHNLALILSNKANLARANEEYPKASKYLHEAIKLYQQILPSDKDGSYNNRLAETLYLASHLAGEMGNTAFQIDYLREASDLPGTKIHARVLLELALLRSELHLPSAIADIELAAELIPSGDPMIDANILVWATQLHAERIAELQPGNSPATAELATEEAEAIKYLEKTVESAFFNPLNFGIMLSTRDNFRPLDHLYGFWNIVYTQMQEGISSNPDEAEKPESAGYYFAARAAVAMAELAESDTAPQFKKPQQLREQANRWLTLKLECLRSAIAEEVVPARYVEQALGLWLTDECWNSVRDDKELAELDVSEAESWRQFWSSVSEIRNELQSSSSSGQNR